MAPSTHCPRRRARAGPTGQAGDYTRVAPGGGPRLAPLRRDRCLPVAIVPQAPPGIHILENVAPGNFTQKSIGPLADVGVSGKACPVDGDAACWPIHGAHPGPATGKMTGEMERRQPPARVLHTTTTAPGRS